jgi:dihydrofolate reductase
MANILYMAISQDGFIADDRDETPWSDAAFEAFEAFVQTCDAVLLGRRTFEIMQENDEFVEGPEYIVATHRDVPVDGFGQVVIQAPEDVPEYERLGIIGGGDLNGQLVQMGVIDELILDIEPIALRHGIRLFGTYEVPLQLELLGSRDLGEGTIQRHYRVIR